MKREPKLYRANRILWHFANKALDASYKYSDDIGDVITHNGIKVCRKVDQSRAKSKAADYDGYIYEVFYFNVHGDLTLVDSYYISTLILKDLMKYCGKDYRDTLGK